MNVTSGTSTKPSKAETARKVAQERRAQRLAAIAEKHPARPTGRGELRRQWRSWARIERRRGNPHTWFRAFAAAKAEAS